MNGTGNEEGISAKAVPQLAERLGLTIERPLPRGSLVYFVRRGDEVKIGFTHRLSQRICGLGRKQDLTLLGTVVGTYTTERVYHERFAHLRLHGEWFRADQELLDAIAAESDALAPWEPTYQDVAQAYIKRARNNLKCGDSGLIYAQTDVGFWLNMLANGGETPERLANLESALQRFSMRA